MKPQHLQYISISFPSLSLNSKTKLFFILVNGKTISAFNFINLSVNFSILLTSKLGRQLSPQKTSSFTLALLNRQNLNPFKSKTLNISSFTYTF